MQMQLSRALPLIVVGAAMLLDGWRPRAEEQHQPQTPPLVISSMYGRDLFQFYCAPCHGRDARGDGPAAASLTHKPADLTAIAGRHGGRFPRKEIERFVSGEGLATPAHGSREMPVWGPIFSSLDPQDTRTRIRISNVVEFIESIQSK